MKSEALFWKTMYDEMHPRTRVHLAHRYMPGYPIHKEQPMLQSNAQGPQFSDEQITVDDLQREIASPYKTPQSVLEVKGDTESTWGGAVRLQTRRDEACAALESNEIQIHDVHSNLGLKCSVKNYEDGQRRRQSETEKLRLMKQEQSREKAHSDEQMKTKGDVERASAAHRAILDALAENTISFHVNSSTITDEGNGLVSKVGNRVQQLLLYHIHKR
jgi:hypothetical protein